MTNTITLSPMQKQLFQLQPQNSHPRVSLRRVLWVRFLRWVDQVKPATLAKLLTSAGTSLLILLTIMAPSFALGLAVSAFRWNGYKIPICLAVFVLTLNAKRIWLWTRRARFARERKGNQHTLEGMPLGDLARWLEETGAWKRDESIKEFALTKGQYQKIADTLKKHGLLYHGENNAQLLREIPMADLVRQLRALAEGSVPPLVWDPEREFWAERDGAFAQMLLSREFDRRKLEEKQERKVERLKRQEERLEEKIEEKEEAIEEGLGELHQPVSLAQIFQYGR